MTKHCTSHTIPSQVPPSEASAFCLRRRARGLLDGGGRRLTLIFAVVVVLTAAVGAFILGEAAYALGFLIIGDSLWVDVVAYAVMGLSGLFGLLPLTVGAYRLACLAAPPRHGSPNLPVTVKEPQAADLLYPFTSLRAYLRALAVGLELLGWFTLMAVIPAVTARVLTVVFDYLAEAGSLLPQWQSPLTLLSGLACVLFGLLMLFLSGYRAGFAYLAMIHDPLPLGEVNRYFKGFRRSFLRPFLLRVSLAGWVAVSILAVLIPFVAHTIPYGMCCSAAYGAELQRK